MSCDSRSDVRPTGHAGRWGTRPSGAPTRVLPTRAPLHVLEAGVPTPAVDPLADGADRIPPGADTFVFLHGYGASSFMWRHWVEPFTRRGRVLLVDIKGFGDAPKPDDGRYSPHDFAEAVTDLIEEHDVRRLTLVGQSLGGGVALLAALRLRDQARESAMSSRLERLVLLAPAAYRQRPPPFVWLSHKPRLANTLLRLVGARRVLRWTMRSVVHDPSTVTEEEVEAYARPWQSRDGLRAALAAGRQIIPPDIETYTCRYGEIDVPTLLIWGDSDRVVPLTVGHRLQQELPNARLVILPRCGHMAPDEHPAASLDATFDFLDANAP